MNRVINSTAIEAATTMYTHMGLSTSSSKAQEEYQKFFRGKLAEYGVESPADIPHDDTDEFFDEVKADWKAREARLDL